MDSLINKLKSLGVDLGLNLPNLQNTKKINLESCLDGKWINNPYGMVFQIDKSISKEYFQGNVKLKKTPLNKSLIDLLKIEEENSDNVLSRICFLDTETSSLNIGSGSFIFLMGFCYLEKGVIKVKQFFLDHPSQELPFLYQIESFISQFKYFSSYNGKSFDIPILKTRLILNSIDISCLDKQHIDLLHLSRSLWKRRLESCKLGEVEKNILGFTRSEIEIPGYLAPIIYKDYLHTRNPTELVNVIYHNEQDVLSLLALLIHINQITDPDSTHNLIDQTDNLSIARLYFRNSNLSNAEYFYRKIVEKTDNKTKTGDLLFEFGLFLRRAGKYNDALELWNTASNLNHIDSMIQMAKHYEHFERDFEKALKLTRKAMELTENDQIPDLSFNDDLDKRKNRLNEKLSKLNDK